MTHIRQFVFAKVGINSERAQKITRTLFDEEKRVFCTEALRNSLFLDSDIGKALRPTLALSMSPKNSAEISPKRRPFRQKNRA
jgi:hypothetical protein